MTLATPRVLHVAAEAHPLVKTGGLADVVGALPPALAARGCDVRLLLPGYEAVLQGFAAGHLTPVGAPLGTAFGASRIQLLRATLPGSTVCLYVIDAPWLYGRAGNPYVDGAGLPWADNHLRFGLLGHVAAQLAAGGLDASWQADIVHAHDWHAALAPVYLRQHPANAVRTVFTIHNLAFQGRFPLDVGPALGLGPAQLTPSALEFHGDLSFMKGALLAADAITTVSPSYAREILRPEGGEGLDGVLRDRASRLLGILNGVDTLLWDSSSDAALAQPYTRDTAPSAKAVNRRALRKECGLADDPRRPLVAVVGRLTYQKGLDLLLEAIADPALADMQLLVLGTGEAGLEQAFSALAAREPGRIATAIRFDEALSHRVFGGADAILVPSRFEPCGLTQLYGLRYGTVPIVRRVGGLADTVVDESTGDSGTGFVFEAPYAHALRDTLARMLAVYQQQPQRWAALMQRGMAQEVSWAGPAAVYGELYQQLMG
ncbi:MAG: glycogen synthase GlgA [Proteobacteria bacterium]|nr:glycogen synthase GlgA [Pseudomonadota bacterium]